LDWKIGLARERARLGSEKVSLKRESKAWMGKSGLQKDSRAWMGRLGWQGRKQGMKKWVGKERVELGL
jgi:hypothetical protein